MIDWGAFVGLPYRPKGRDREGLDCWGLYRLLMAEGQGIDLPSFAGDYVDPQERAGIEALIWDQDRAGIWHAVEDIQAFDLLLYQVAGNASHVACAVDSRRMIHVHAGSHVVIQPMAHRMWRDRLVGIFRHIDVQGAAA